MKKLILILAGIVLLASCTQNTSKTNDNSKQKAEVTQAEKDLLAKAQMFFKPLPEEAPNIDNPVTAEKVILGKQLYFDTRLSKDGTQSCNTCHNLSTFGVDNLATSPGDNGVPGTRNSPTTFNAAHRSAQFWDGRNKDVEEQAGGPVMNPAEMGMPSEDVVVERLEAIPGYATMFAAAFPEDENAISFLNMQKAIGAFERTLITPSRFDDYLAGDVHALNAEEQAGMAQFMDNGCIACHSGPLLGGTMLQKVGVFGDYHEVMNAQTVDHGKYEETKVETDKGMFYTPGLRNVEKTAPYFHNGGVSDLGESIRIMAKIQLNKELTDEQVNTMVAFFSSLTGDIPDDVKKAPDTI
jgi:cytochrome c peroxidase